MWSPEQEHAIKLVRRWMKKRDRQVFRLFGYAGTGKTTLAQELGRGYALTRFAAFTGKATDVMRQRGCEPVSTIHKLIYLLIEDEETGELKFGLRPREDLDRVGMIVIDEASMVDQDLARDLLSFGIPILVIMDPFQLPSIGNGGSFFAHAKPDAMLTQIHRQAADNPILRLAHQIRRGKSLPKPGYRAGDALRITNGDFDPNDFDVELCGLNETRHRYNRHSRRHFGFARGSSNRLPPQKGETVVCLANDYTIKEPVFNGTTWEVISTEPTDDRRVPTIELRLRSKYDGKTTTTVRVALECFNEHKLLRYYGLQQFDFGYCLTVHKAQGSEWSRVLLINEARFFRAEAARWLYTGITRAEKKLTIADYG
jgi:exodeoxyribonuclease-5